MAGRSAVGGAAAAILGVTLVLASPAGAACTITCTTDVPTTVQVAETMRYQGTVTATGCASAVSDYEWSYAGAGSVVWVLCDGTAANGAIPPCEKTMYSPRTIDWSLWVSNSGSSAKCTGTLKVSGLSLGSTVFNADETIVNSENSFTLRGNVRANNVLRFEGPVTFLGSPWGNTGDLFTDYDIFVSTAPHSSTILTGTGQHYWFDGNFTPPRLSPQLTEPLTELGFKLEGVPLYLMESPIGIEGSRVLLAPTMFVGKADGLHPASIQLQVALLPGMAPGLLPGTSLRNGAGAPGIEVKAVRELFYDGANDTLTGKLDLSFPFLDVTKGGIDVVIPAAIEVADGCIDTLEAAPADVAGDVVKLSPWERPFLELSGVLITDICDSTRFARLLFGTMYFQTEKFASAERVEGSAWLYEPPHEMTLAAGTPMLLNRPLTGSGGSSWFGLGTYDALFLKGSYGTGGLPKGSVIAGTLRASLLSWTHPYGVWDLVGRLKGTFTLGPSCACPESVKIDCEMARKAVLKLFPAGSSPPDRTFTVEGIGNSNNEQFQVVFRGKEILDESSTLTFGVKSVWLSGASSPVVSCVYGANLGRRTTSRATALGGFRAAAAVERSVTLAQTEELAVFGVRGTTGATPGIYLVSPSGARITPTTTAQLPGSAYSSDDEAHLAQFAVRDAAPGTWAIGEDTLPEADVEFIVLAPQPPPVTTVAVGSVSGSSVGISATVTPASAETKVAFRYSRTTDGTAEGTIASGLAATAGTVGATWDLTPLPSGTYYVFAVTDDGKNPPITTFAPSPISRDVGGLAAPTGLHATRSSDAVTLTWTPSVSAGVIGYTVMSTDDPGQPGYQARSAAALPTGMTVAGLRYSKRYRFCALAYDGAGNQSPCSQPVTVEPTRPSPRRRLPDARCETLGPQPTPTFTDVTTWACPIRKVVEAGLMTGCAADRFCPSEPVSRADMAFALVNARRLGGSVVLPAPVGLFADVPSSSPDACYVEQLYRDGVTGGCASNPLRFCPDAAVTRETAAIFLLRAALGSSWVPPACTGMFEDVPCTATSARFVEELARRCITGGCGTNPPRYCPDDTITRGQLAVFLWRLFLLPQACGVPIC